MNNCVIIVNIDSAQFAMFSRSTSYIIAEVGQNHQGDIKEALRYISVFAALGADAIKFQMRNNKLLFDSSVYNQLYNSSNSFGKTYGDHREKLELSFEDFLVLKDRSALCEVDFIVTPFDESSLSKCIELKVDALKVASFDIGNIPFLELVGQTMLPVIISTGGATISQITNSVSCLSSHHDEIALLHCVSKYPCPPSEMQLRKIETLRARFPNLTIGLSDHFNGIITGPISYMLGARVFEKHVTFDRALKGTDHPFSLEPDGFRRFVRDIKRTPVLLETNDGKDKELGKEPVFQKLGKSLVANTDIARGQKIEGEMLSGKIIIPSMIPVRESCRVIGKVAAHKIKQGAFLQYSDLD